MKVLVRNLILLGMFMFCNHAWAEVLDDESTTVEMEGNYADHKTRSLILPLEVIQSGSQVSVTFYESVSDVTITITSDSGSQETRTTSFSSMQTETFDTSDYASGTYTLLITTPRGTYLHGSFIVE